MDCNHYLDELQKMSDEPLKDCPKCHKPKLKRLLSAPSFRLKGGGWYETDFKKENQRNIVKSDSDNDKKKTSNKKEDELLIEMVFQLGIKNCLKFDNLLKKPLYYFLLLLIFYFAFNTLSFPESFGLVDSSEFGVKMILSKSFSLLLIVTIFWTILQSVEYLGARLKFRAEQTESKVDDQLIPFAIEIVKVLVVIFAIVFILANVFDQNVTALAAGLGVGGVAVALASKESLENLLGSFTIFLDKPFQVGDIITLGSTTGLVEKVGFRSTRLRTFDKSIVTVPNKNLVNAELDNLGLRPVRRVKTNIGLIYSTPIEQIKNIVNDIQELIDDHKQTTQDGKVRFLNFGDSSLDVMVLYFVNSPDWNILVDTQQEINFKIIEIVKKHQSDFAYPTTSVFLENQKS